MWPFSSQSSVFRWGLCIHFCEIQSTHILMHLENLCLYMSDTAVSNDEDLLTGQRIFNGPQGLRNFFFGDSNSGEESEEE